MLSLYVTTVTTHACIVYLDRQMHAAHTDTRTHVHDTHGWCVKFKLIRQTVTILLSSTLSAT